MADLLMPPPPQLPYSTVREAGKRVAKFLVPAGRHHSEWKLSFDLDESATQVIVRAEDVVAPDDWAVGRVLSWMWGVERVRPVVNPTTGQPIEMTGDYEDDVDFAFWGFVDATLVLPDGRSGQKLLEDQMDLMKAGFFLNRRWGLDPPQSEYFTRAGLLDFGPIDTHHFSEGVDAWVGQGKITARVQRLLA